MAFRCLKKPIYRNVYNLINTTCHFYTIHWDYLVLTSTDDKRQTANGNRNGAIFIGGASVAGAKRGRIFGCFNWSSSFSTKSFLSSFWSSNSLHLPPLSSGKFFLFFYSQKLKLLCKSVLNLHFGDLFVFTHKWVFSKSWNFFGISGFPISFFNGVVILLELYYEILHLKDSLLHHPQVGL